VFAFAVLLGFLLQSRSPRLAVGIGISVLVLLLAWCCFWFGVAFGLVLLLVLLSITQLPTYPLTQSL
jgi:hypothetical protein